MWSVWGSSYRCTFQKLSRENFGENFREVIESGPWTRPCLEYPKRSSSDAPPSKKALNNATKELEEKVKNLRERTVHRSLPKVRRKV